MKNLILALIVLTFVLSSCNRAEKKWELAQETNTIQSYEDYLLKYPENQFTEEANKKILELKESIDWDSVSKVNDLLLYKDFLKKWPDGKYFDQAKLQVKLIEYSEIIELTALEWFNFWEFDEAKNVKINNQELLDKSELRKAVRRFPSFTKSYGSSGVRTIHSRSFIDFTMDNVSNPWTLDINSGRITANFETCATMEGTEACTVKKVEGGFGFVFNNKWSAPILTEGNKLPRITFSSGSINLVNGDVVIKDSTMFRISNEEFIYVDGRLSLL